MLSANKLEPACEKRQKGIGLTTAVVAVLMAIANLLANAANTQRVIIETKTADWWTLVSGSPGCRVLSLAYRVAAFLATFLCEHCCRNRADCCRIVPILTRCSP